MQPARERSTASAKCQPEAAREDWLQASWQFTDCSDKVTAVRGCWPLRWQRLVGSLCIDVVVIGFVRPCLRHLTG